MQENATSASEEKMTITRKGSKDTKINRIDPTSPDFTLGPSLKQVYLRMEHIQINIWEAI